MDTDLKLTGYPDIDKLLKETYALRKNGEELKKQIEESLKFKPNLAINLGSRKRQFKYTVKDTDILNALVFLFVKMVEENH